MHRYLYKNYESNTMNLKSNTINDIVITRLVIIRLVIIRLV
ncbi:hypothetical protein KSS87_011478, partial [Heliosperma pusillum]